MKILSAKLYYNKLKATIQSTGRLGFTEDTTRALRLDENTSVKFLQDDSKGEDSESELYMVILHNTQEEDAFPVKKSGAYFYVPTAILFSELNFEYKTKTYIFDLVRNADFDAEFNGEVYKMYKRVKEKCKNDVES